MRSSSPGFSARRRHRNGSWSPCSTPSVSATIVLSSSTAVPGSASKASSTPAQRDVRARRRTRTARPAPGARSWRRRCGGASARRRGRGSRSRCRRCRPGSPPPLRRHHEGGDDVPVAVVPDVAPQRAGRRLLERAQQLRGQRARPGAVLRRAGRDRGEQAVALLLELGDEQRARVLAVDVAQRLAARAVLVALADRLAVVGERHDRAEAERAPLGVVAGEHLLVHVEEQLALAVLELHAARAGAPARRVDDVPVAVVVVGERVLAEPVERRLAPDRARRAARPRASRCGGGIGGIASRAASGSWTMNSSTAWRTSWTSSTPARRSASSSAAATPASPPTSSAIFMSSLASSSARSSSDGMNGEKRRLGPSVEAIFASTVAGSSVRVSRASARACRSSSSSITPPVGRPGRCAAPAPPGRGTRRRRCARRRRAPPRTRRAARRGRPCRRGWSGGS